MPVGSVMANKLDYDVRLSSILGKSEVQIKYIHVVRQHDLPG